MYSWSSRTKTALHSVFSASGFEKSKSPAHHDPQLLSHPEASKDTPSAKLSGAATIATLRDMRFRRAWVVPPRVKALTFLRRLQRSEEKSTDKKR